LKYFKILENQRNTNNTAGPDSFSTEERFPPTPFEQETRKMNFFREVPFIRMR
jgi:hypothetical protein